MVGFGGDLRPALGGGAKTGGGWGPPVAPRAGTERGKSLWRPGSGAGVVLVYETQPHGGWTAARTSGRREEGGPG